MEHLLVQRALLHLMLKYRFAVLCRFSLPINDSIINLWPKLCYNVLYSTYRSEMTLYHIFLADSYVRVLWGGALTHRFSILVTAAYSTVCNT